MRKIAAGCAGMVAVVLLGTGGAEAATLEELRASLGSARAKVVAMVNSSDKPEQEKLQQDVKAVTQQVDATLAALMTDGATPAAVKAKLEEFKATWESFKQTRDSELIPAVLAGEKDKAKAIATGVQAERFKKMTGLLE